MDRTTARALAKTTLEGLSLFGKVFLSEPESFGGYDPVAVVHSKSLGIVLDVRDDTRLPTELYVTIYVKRARDLNEADRDAVEETLDSLSKAAALALWSAFDVRGLVIGPSDTGYPQRQFDNTPYRLERFAVRFDDETEE